MAHVNTRQGLPLDRAWSLMPRDYGCCGTEKPAKRGEVESPLRLGQRPNECDALANRASCEAHPVAHVNTRQGLPGSRAVGRSLNFRASVPAARVPQFTRAIAYAHI